MHCFYDYKHLCSDKVIGHLHQSKPIEIERDRLRTEDGYVLYFLGYSISW